MSCARFPPLTVIVPPLVLSPADAATGLPGPRRGRPVAFWDLDGTLTRSDTLLPFLRRAAGTAAVMRALAAVAGRDLPRPRRKALLLQLLLGGRSVADVDQVARRYAAAIVASRLRSDSVDWWKWHRRAGHRRVIASASPGVYVHHLGRLLGADAVLCTEMAAVNGRLTGGLRGGACCGAEKARRAVTHLAEQPASRVWAYANGDVDRPLLALADVAVRVSPYRRLRRPDTR